MTVLTVLYVNSIKLIMSVFFGPSAENSLPALSKEERLVLAQEHWFDENQPRLPLKQLADMYGVARSTLNDRIKNGVRSKEEANQGMQRLSPGEEQALEVWICQLHQWGWPAKVYQVRGMAHELLQARNDTRELGVNWINQFLARHPSLKSKFVGGLDKTRVASQDPSIISAWFEVFAKHRVDVEDEDIYNMDEKGIMTGANEAVKCIISKHEKKLFMTAIGSREWVSLIECISMANKTCPPWIIFKGKLLKASWLKALKSGYIAVSENGWTDIELGIAWLRDCFHPNTLRLDEQGYQRPRILIYDGHSSHISNEAIQFCLSNQIRPLCLPRHSTHFLQPLDVGVFNALAHYYKQGLANRCRYSAHYFVDKVDFLEILQEARAKAFTEPIIQSAWQKVGLSPLNPAIILDTFQPRPITPIQKPTLTYTSSSGSTLQVGLTPRNAKDVETLVSRVLEGENLGPVIAFEIKKLQKFAMEMMANSTIQNSTNKELLGQLKKEDDKKKRVAAGDETLAGYGRYMGAEVLQTRHDWGAQKHFDETWKSLSKIGIELIGVSRVAKAPLKLSGRGNAKAFIALWKEFATTPKLDVFTADITTSWVLDLTATTATTTSKGSRPATKRPATEKPRATSKPKLATTRAGRTVKTTIHFDSI
jgi:hypothetical protein